MGLICATLFVSSVAAMDPLPLPAQGPPTWTDARGALEDEHWEAALVAAQATLQEDGDHAGAKFVEGYALHQLRQWEGSLKAIHQVVDDEEVGDLARRHVALYDNRWRRNQPSLSLGLGLNDDRGLTPRGMRPTFAAELEVPIIWQFSLRGDLTTPWATEDQLEMQGPLLGLMAVFQQPISIWAFDLAGGPTLWMGRSAFWKEQLGGPFPGLRLAAGGSVRPLKNLGVRLEGGWSATRGTHAMLNAWSRGFDVRLMLTGYVW
jgi:hypothetical protein